MTPRLSIVMVVYNMRREAPRTLFSLSPDYQDGVSADDYEVIVVDNGSQRPLAEEEVTGLGHNYRYLAIENAHPSPAAALNHGAALSQGRHLGLMIDGARLATPGIIREALQCLDSHERAVVATLGFHLGPDLQSISMVHGYDQKTEDRLLQQVKWRDNGYRLFEISSLAGSSRFGQFNPLAESNLLFLSRRLYDELDGTDEAFDLPGGGMVNLDLYFRACKLPRTSLFVLLGEATFHQVHGGTHTGVPLAEADRMSVLFNRQYTELRGSQYRPPSKEPIYFGKVRPEVLPWLQKSCDLVRRWNREQSRTTPAAAGASAGSTNGICGPRERDRNDVDPAARRDLLDALPFSLLTILGLREHHRVLELGSLVASRLLVPFLLPSSYYGIACSNQNGPGISAELGELLVARKKPQWTVSDELDSRALAVGFDFILAHMVFYRAGYHQLGQYLKSSRRALRAQGLLVAAFVEHEEDMATNDWVYPELNYYSWSTISHIAGECGLHCRKIDWPHPLKTWFVATSDIRRLDMVTATGIELLPDELTLTGGKRQALDLERAEA
jgi:glycosyltransferase involved in cell wall biosynthesis